MQILKNSDDEDKIYYNNFVYSFKTEVTRKNSLTILKYFMKFLGIESLRELVIDKPQKIIESDIKAYLVYLRTKKKISHGAAVLYLSVVKKFYIVNTDYSFRWNLINMYLGNDDNDIEAVAAKEEPPTIPAARVRKCTRNSDKNTTKTMKISGQLYQRFLDHSSKYYNVESYETILEDLLDSFDKHNQDKRWYNNTDLNK